MLKLPNVTLLMLETRCHELARLAIENSCSAVEFGDVVVITDRPEKIRVPGASYSKTEDWPDKLGYCRALWYHAPLKVKTDQCLIIQWDSWIIRPDLWKDEFLEYDYIGAPWHYFDGYNVGNSGFSLRSNDLMQHLLEKHEEYPCSHDAEDALLCRGYRPFLENEFKWAPEYIAAQFSVDHKKVNGFNTFGFHGSFNFPHVLNKDQLTEWDRLMAGNPYIKQTPKYDEIITLAPSRRSDIYEAA